MCVKARLVDILLRKCKAQGPGFHPSMLESGVAMFHSDDDDGETVGEKRSLTHTFLLLFHFFWSEGKAVKSHSTGPNITHSAAESLCCLSGRLTD